MDMALFIRLFRIPVNGYRDTMFLALKSPEPDVSRMSASSMLRGKKREVDERCEIFFTKSPFLPYSLDKVWRIMDLSPYLVVCSNMNSELFSIRFRRLP